MTGEMPFAVLSAQCICIERERNVTDGIIHIPLHPTVSRKEEQNDFYQQLHQPSAESESDSKRKEGREKG